MLGATAGRCDFFKPTLYISIHAPVLGATKVSSLTKTAKPLFQSTHPCWVRPSLQLLGVLITHDISIHAPVLGATGNRDQAIPYPGEISIHAPVLGATYYLFTHVHYPFYFNPRTRAGCDTFGISRPLISPVFQSTHPCWVRPAKVQASRRSRQRFQSTHPCWVRRMIVFFFVRFFLNFNPRTRAGCDPWASRRVLSTRSFQSTHPCWVRLGATADYDVLIFNFNPRTRAGCDT